ncbi:MAG: hypothetical protein Kow00121_47260 [Elainellaceae cyanobacterium]
MIGARQSWISWIKLAFLGTMVVGSNSLLLKGAAANLAASPAGSLAGAIASASAEPDFIRPPADCPSDLEALIPLLLRDLPGYANRVNQRAYTLESPANIPGYVLVAGRPEYEPIPLESRQYIPQQEGDTTAQIFFTTLERQYAAGKAVQLQHYHWVFLTQTSSGWRLVMMFSTIGDVPADEPPTPPQDTSQGVIAQAIRLWLRDCQAGSIAPAS